APRPRLAQTHIQSNPRFMPPMKQNACRCGKPQVLARVCIREGEVSLRRLFAAPPRRGPVQNLNGAGGCALERARARWVPRMGATKRAIRCLAGASAATALLVGVVAVAPAQPGYVSDDPEWRFRQHGRRAKVALIAGS